MLTNKCNSHCVHCNVWKNKDIPFNLNYDKAKEIITDFTKLCLSEDIKQYHELNFTGQGEPTLYNKLWDLIRYAKDIDPTNRVTKSIITNSINLTKDNIIDKILYSKIDMVIFSINSHIPDVHDYSRGTKDNYEHIMIIVKEIYDYKIKHNLEFPKLCISSMIADWNYDHFIEFIDYMESIKYFSYFTFAVMAWTVKEKKWLSKNYEISQVIKKCQEKYKDSIFLKYPYHIYNEMIGYALQGEEYHTFSYCRSAHNNLITDENLNLQNCFSKNEIMLGNLKNNTLIEIINKPFVQKLLQVRMKGNCNLWCAQSTCMWS